MFSERDLHAGRPSRSKLAFGSSIQCPGAIEIAQHNQIGLWLVCRWRVSYQQISDDRWDRWTVGGVEIVPGIFLSVWLPPFGVPPFWFLPGGVTITAGCGDGCEYFHNAPPAIAAPTSAAMRMDTNADFLRALGIGVGVTTGAGVGTLGTCVSIIVFCRAVVAVSIMVFLPEAFSALLNPGM